MPEIYRSSHASSIADLMRQRGMSAANRARMAGDLEAQKIAQSGQIWGNAIQGIAQGVTGTLRDFAQARQPDPVRQLQVEKLTRELKSMDVAEAQAKIGQLAEVALGAPDNQELHDTIAQTMAQLSPEYGDMIGKARTDPQAWSSVLSQLRRLSPGYKAPEGFTLGEGQTRFDPSGTQIANVPKPEPVQQPFTLSPGSSRFNPDGTPIASVPATPPDVNLSPEDVLLDGKPAKAVFNPKTGKYTVNGEDVSSRVQPLPPQRTPPTPDYMWAKDPKTGETRLMSHDEIRTTGAGQPDTADMRNKGANKKVAARAVDAVRTLGTDIFKRVGPAQRAEAIKRGVDAVFGNDPKFRTYQDSRMALAGTLAVEQQGSRVSDADVRALWLPMIPDAYRDTEESYRLKWELIDTMRGVDAPKPDDPNAFDEEWVYDSKGNLVKKPKP